MKRSTAVIRFVETYCRVPEGVRVGEPLKLMPFQRDFLRAVYDNPAGTEKAILSIARKNGKTCLIACLLLAHLVGPEARQNSQIVSAAMSREQAALVFGLACKMIRQNPELERIIHIIPSGKRLTGKLMGTEYRALAADSATAQGLSPVLVILDEIGQVRGAQNGFIDALTTAQGAHEHPLLLAISTQAADDADLLSLWLDDAKRTDDPHIVCRLHAADVDAALDDRSAWKAANPALGKFRSRRDLEKLAREAQRMPSAENTFRNLNLNQRVATHNPFISPAVWKSCGGDPSPLEGLEVYGGLDLSAHTDLTALVLLGRDGDGIVHVHPYFWAPREGLEERARRDRAPYDAWMRAGFLRTTPGATVGYGHVARDIAELTAALDLRAVAYDRWRIDVLRKYLDEMGIALPLVPHGQGYRDMSPALDRLEADLLNAALRHGGHPVLAMCACNAVLERDPAGNRKLAKHKATGRIDGMVALAMAETAALAGPKPNEVTAAQMDEYLNHMVVM